MTITVPPLLAQTLHTFLTPIWLLSLGVSLGFVVLLIVWGILALISRRAAGAVPRVVADGVLAWVTFLVFALIGLSILASPFMPLRQVLSSVQRSVSVGKMPPETFTVPAGAEDQPIDISFRSDELVSYTIESDRELLFAQEPGAMPESPLFAVRPNEPFTWSSDETMRSRLFEGYVGEVYVSNPGDKDASLTVALTTEVAVPEVYGLTTAAFSVVCVYVVYFLLIWLAPRLSAIAVATAREAVSQPLYLLLLTVGAIALIVFVYIPYHTFGEDVKMLKVVGMSLVMVLSIIVALWTSSVSVAEEIEGRTALTLLSKPIGRKQFVLGKFAGIAWAIFLMFVVLGIVLLISISWKVIYDARETSNPPPEWQECYAAMVTTVPGLVLAFIEAVVMASLAVAISTRLPMLPNLIVCGAIFVVGHLVALIVASAAGEIEFVAFVGRLIATVLPVLDYFNVEAAISGDVDLPLSYLGWTALYGILYCTAAMLLGLFLFEDRDLA